MTEPVAGVTAAPCVQFDRALSVAERHHLLNPVAVMHAEHSGRIEHGGSRGRRSADLRNAVLSLGRGTPLYALDEARIWDRRLVVKPKRAESTAAAQSRMSPGRP